MSIDIVMATYNGAKFLPQQLESLEAQTHQDWRLLIRDDGSADKTTDIIHKFAARHPGKVVFFDNQNKRLGAKANFGQLLSVASADYVMCCDQDDVWMPDKIAKTLAKMQEMEQKYGKDIPLLVHTDSTVTDASLNVTHKSFGAVLKRNRDEPKFEKVLMQGVIQGCTQMANRKLVEKASPVPKDAEMHDTWMGLVASATGHVGYLAEPTVLYRQHDANVYGARIDNKKTWQQKVRSVNSAMKRHINQAQALLEQNGDDLTPQRRQVLEDFVHLNEMGSAQKKITLLAHGHLREPLWKNADVVFWR